MTQTKEPKGASATQLYTLLLAVMALPIGIQGKVGAGALLIRLFIHFECPKALFVDGGYTGTLIEWALSMLGWNMQVIKRCQQRICTALPQAAGS